MADDTILAHCDDCGNDTTFSAALAESVQVCTKCGAYIDVPALADEGAAAQSGAGDPAAGEELDAQLDRLEEILVRQETLAEKLTELIKRGEEVATRLEAVLEEVEE